MPNKKSKSDKPSKLSLYLDSVNTVPPVSELKRIEVAAESVKASCDSRPTAKVKGHAVRDYVEICDLLKQAEEAKGTTGKTLLPVGVRAVFEHNLRQSESVSSAELSDETGTQLLVTVKNQYPSVKADGVTVMFAQMRAKYGFQFDINDLVGEKLKASFNGDVFLDEKGDFIMDRFKAFKTAIDEVALRLGCTSPLEYAKVVTVKSDFHEARWSRFPLLEAQLEIQESIPATVSAKAL